MDIPVVPSAIFWVIVVAQVVYIAGTGDASTLRDTLSWICSQSNAWGACRVLRYVLAWWGGNSTSFQRKELLLGLYNLARTNAISVINIVFMNVIMAHFETHNTVLYSQTLVSWRLSLMVRFCFSFSYHAL